MKEGLQKELVVACIENTGSERNLSKALGIPKSSIYYYKYEKWYLPEKRFESMMSLINVKKKLYFKKGIISFLEDNWGRKKGGQKLIESKIKNGEFDVMIKKLKKITSKRLKIWHAKMKKENPDLYYKTLYDKFKKIGEYKYRSLRGEKVRNALEKNVADFLYRKNIFYEYEPYLKIKNAVFFPDFKINNIIIECTFWKGYSKASKLKKKIYFYKKMGYSIFVLVPINLIKYYKTIKEFVITDVNELPL